MLDANKRYYVDLGGHLRSVVEAWAEENDLILEGGMIELLGYAELCRLFGKEVNGLKMKPGRFGAKKLRLLNGKREIGWAKEYVVDGKVRVVISPEIRDR